MVADCFKLLNVNEHSTIPEVANKLIQEIYVIKSSSDNLAVAKMCFCISKPDGYKKDKIRELNKCIQDMYSEIMSVIGEITPLLDKREWSAISEKIRRKEAIYQKIKDKDKEFFSLI